MSFPAKREEKLVMTSEGTAGEDDFEIIKKEDMPQDISESSTALDTEVADIKTSTKPDMLGYRIELKWSSGKWYRGTICEYNPTKRKHKVMYDDGDLKWYYLPEMVFKFIEEEEEWIKC